MGYLNKKVFFALIFNLAICLAFNSILLAAPNKQIKTKFIVDTIDLDLQNLSQDSGIIFKGKLISINEKKDRNLDLDVRYLKFQVEDTIKGLNSGTKEIILKEWATAQSPVEGQVKAGDSYVFFFNKPSQLGLTSLIGQEQGLVTFDKSGGVHLATRKKTNSRVDSLTSTGTFNSYENFKKLCNSYIEGEIQ